LKNFPALADTEATMRLDLWFGLAVLSGLLVAGPDAEAQVRRFDGTWSVEVVTEQGDCDRAYRYAIRIENGRARYGGPEAFAVNGQVRSNGTVTGSIARGSNRANVTGRLQGEFGTGTWRTSGARNCSGRWNAERRG
jgi:hypothetical protein